MRAHDASTSANLNLKPLNPELTTSERHEHCFWRRNAAGPASKAHPSEARGVGFRALDFRFMGWGLRVKVGI